MKENDDKKISGKETLRPPVVVVMGHIDHGKSTLLDYIRKENSTEHEAGGITQHISAYEAEIDDPENKKEKRKITFLDTPGHEAFCSIRERGSRVADIAILVVSAEDGVKPQTIEALNCIKKDGVPFIVALNKIDRPGANVDKIKQNLAENEVLVEGWGGTIPCVPISAKTGENIPDLLEMIALQSDIEELKGDHSIPAEGFVIESDLNPKQGISATLIIKTGTLKVGAFVSAKGGFAKIRAIENYAGENMKEATFSSPVKIVGWNAVPFVGSEFKTFKDKEEAEGFASIKEEKNPSSNEVFVGAHLGLVVKADTFGSLDAIEHELQKLNNEKMGVKVILKGIGKITEGDIKTANVKKSLVIGFNVGTDKSAEVLALRDGTDIKTFKIIYELIDFVSAKIKEATPIETVEMIVGTAKIMRTFSKNKDKQVIGGKVEEGEIKLGSSVKIMRRDAHIGEGKVKEIQSQKIKTDLAKTGQEFGMMVESKIELAEGDKLQATTLVKQ